MSPMSMGTTDCAGRSRQAAAPRIDLELNAESIAALPPSLTFFCPPSLFDLSLQPGHVARVTRKDCGWKYS